MICISALCIVLALSSIAESAANQDKVEQLEEEIASAVAGQLAAIANDAAAAKLNTKDLNKKLLAATNAAFRQMEPQIKELIQLSGSSPEVLAKDLSRRINQNQALKDALPEGGELSPRFSGVVGTIGTIAYDIVKGLTHIIIGPTK